MGYFYIAVLTLGTIAFIAAIVLYICSKRFAVKEDNRIEKVASLLPQANCGGCGYPGCHGFAAAIVKATEKGVTERKSCPVGGKATMERISQILGVDTAMSSPQIAVVRCSGTCDLLTPEIRYSGLRTCSAMNMSGVGENACGYGCLGGGDCTSVCQFEAIHINTQTGVAEIDEDKCIGCGACTRICPRHIIELRNKGPEGRRVYVSCMNKDKGPTAMKVCSVSCISCGRCVKACSFDAITMEDNVAYINHEKCHLCRECEKVCVRHSIVAVNFPMPDSITH